MVRLLRTLFNWLPGRQPRATRPYQRPCLEVLEQRALPSASHLASDIRTELANAQSDVKTLTTELASSANPRVRADIAALGVDFAAVAADVTANRSPTGPLDKVFAVDHDLITELGKSSSAARLLRDLRRELRELSGHVEGADRIARARLKDIDKELAALDHSLSAESRKAVQSDIDALNADLTAIAKDSKSGKSSATDLAKAKSDAAKLAAKLKADTNARVQHALDDIRKDLDSGTTRRASSGTLRKSLP